MGAGCCCVGSVRCGKAAPPTRKNRGVRRVTGRVGGSMSSHQFSLYPLFPRSRTPAYVVRLPRITLWFSYQTLVAFAHPTRGMVCVENEWGPTTGKHLNAICARSRRVSREEFERLLEEVRPLLVSLAMED